jgi:hypothetical protein
VATLLPGLFSLAQLDTWQAITLVIVGLAAIQFLIGNYLEPLVAGAALSISPFAVVFAVFFWGFLWGIPGALIGVPIAITIIAICAKYPSSYWVATLLSQAGGRTEGLLGARHGAQTLDTQGKERHAGLGAGRPSLRRYRGPQARSAVRCCRSPVACSSRLVSRS